MKVDSIKNCSPDPSSMRKMVKMHFVEYDEGKPASAELCSIFCDVFPSKVNKSSSIK